ncbi:unnamed protein product [Mesocestoides corti]|uniref:Flocculation protein FLO11-like n=1 Tax=Mesocestoides corti TaxID=53468 RepID=A0A0R3UM32_MESCO|nr:unnamed protein product [Mesocestoides corti]
MSKRRVSDSLSQVDNRGETAMSADANEPREDEQTIIVPSVPLFLDLYGAAVEKSATRCSMGSRVVKTTCYLKHLEFSCTRTQSSVTFYPTDLRYACLPDQSMIDLPTSTARSSKPPVQYRATLPTFSSKSSTTPIQSTMHLSATGTHFPQTTDRTSTPMHLTKTDSQVVPTQSMTRSPTLAKLLTTPGSSQTSPVASPKKLLKLSPISQSSPPTPKRSQVASIATASQSTSTSSFTKPPVILISPQTSPAPSPVKPPTPPTSAQSTPASSPIGGSKIAIQPIPSTSTHHLVFPKPGPYLVAADSEYPASFSPPIKYYSSSPPLRVELMAVDVSRRSTSIHPPPMATEQPNQEPQVSQPPGLTARGSLGTSESDGDEIANASCSSNR